MRSLLTPGSDSTAPSCIQYQYYIVARAKLALRFFAPTTALPVSYCYFIGHFMQPPGGARTLLDEECKCQCVRKVRRVLPQTWCGAVWDRSCERGRVISEGILRKWVEDPVVVNFLTRDAASAVRESELVGRSYWLSICDLRNGVGSAVTSAFEVHPQHLLGIFACGECGDEIATTSSKKASISHAVRVSSMKQVRADSRSREELFYGLASLVACVEAKSEWPPARGEKEEGRG